MTILIFFLCVCEISLLIFPLLPIPKFSLEFSNLFFFLSPDGSGLPAYIVSLGEEASHIFPASVFLNNK